MDRGISRQEWLIFLDEKCTVDDAISEWSEKSKAKVGQVVFRILFDAGYLTDTKDPEIVCPLIPHELEESLLENDEGKYLSLMELRAKI
jgi:hypothetical protein